MRFVFTLNMPSFKNDLVHEIIGEYQATSLTEIYAHLMRGQSWFLVSQFYKDGGEWKERGEILINERWIGKIKAFV